MQLTHNQNGHEHLRPVCLMGWLESCYELSDEERQHGDHDRERDRSMRKHKSRHSSSEETTNHRRHELSRDEQRCLSADFKQEAPAEVNPDAEGAPSDTDQSHGIYHWLRQHRDWDKRRHSARFYPNEGDETQKADD